ncbi:MYB98 [Hepatospora eriocheir]|uniref:MYB98 n=1 Tax=Hepatospora eriocheir TaxID=1081669 RepID=A0A1X0QIH1_9MICR|nr:MYB98 [Hepatospora eriocheir]
MIYKRDYDEYISNKSKLRESSQLKDRIDKKINQIHFLQNSIDYINNTRYDFLKNSYIQYVDSYSDDQVIYQSFVDGYSQECFDDYFCFNKKLSRRNYNHKELQKSYKIPVKSIMKNLIDSEIEDSDLNILFSDIEAKEISTQKVIKKGKWTSDEDEMLMSIIYEFGLGNWSLIAKLMPNRNNKQCLERYLNHLDPSLNKTPLTEKEKELILKLQKKFGNKWTKIASELGDRSEIIIKNFFFSYKRKNE